MISFFILSMSLQGQNIKTILKGEIADILSDTLILVKESEDLVSGKKIPVKEGKFNYLLEAEHLEKYEIIISEELRKGYFRPVQFFPDTCKIVFRLYPSSRHNETIVTGGELNRKMQSFNNETEEHFLPQYKSIEAAMDSLRSLQRLYSDEFEKLLEKIAEADEDDESQRLAEIRDHMIISGEAFTEEAKSVINKTDSLNLRLVNWQKDYIKSNDDIFAYSLLLSLFTQYPMYEELIDAGMLKDIFILFRKKYPRHPYTQEIEKILAGMEN